MQATTQYFVERFFYKQGLDYHGLSKILCQTSGHQNHWSLLRREGKLTAHKSTYLPHNPDEGNIYETHSFVDCLLYTIYVLFMWPWLLHIFEHKLYIQYNTCTSTCMFNTVNANSWPIRNVDT